MNSVRVNEPAMRDEEKGQEILCKRVQEVKIPGMLGKREAADHNKDSP